MGLEILIISEEKYLKLCGEVQHHTYFCYQTALLVAGLWEWVHPKVDWDGHEVAIPRTYILSCRLSAFLHACSAYLVVSFRTAFNTNILHKLIAYQSSTSYWACETPRPSNPVRFLDVLITILDLLMWIPRHGGRRDQTKETRSWYIKIVRYPWRLR